jgi:hypothetical protein
MSKKVIGPNERTVLLHKAKAVLISTYKNKHGSKWADVVQKEFNLPFKADKEEQEKDARNYLRGLFNQIAEHLGMDAGALASEVSLLAVAAKPAIRRKAVSSNASGANRGDDVEPCAILRKSTLANPVQVVWETCEAMRDQRRKDVVEACIKKGVAFYTARTQYQLWKSAGKATPAK